MNILLFGCVLTCFAGFSSTTPTPTAASATVLASFSSKYGFPDQRVIETLYDHTSDEVALGWELLGEGSHRSLHYALDAEALPCGAQIVQELPPELFVDPYELQALARNLGQAITFEVRGKVDLETPAPGCTSTLLVGRMNAMQPRGGNVTLHANVSGDLDHALKGSKTIAIPMHAKYPEPLLRPRARNGGSFSWLFGEIVDVVVPRPILLVDDCEGGWRVGSRGTTPKNVVWEIPSGSLQHLGCVQRGTMLIVVASALVILCGVVLAKGGKEMSKKE